MDDTELQVRLASGDRVLELDAGDLAARINAIVWPSKTPTWQI